MAKDIYNIIKGTGLYKDKYYLRTPQPKISCIGCAFYDNLGECCIPKEMDKDHDSTKGIYISITEEEAKELEEKHRNYKAEQEAKAWERKLERDLSNNAKKNLDELSLATGFLVRDLLVWARMQNDGGIPWPDWMNEDIKLLIEICKSQNIKID